MIYKYVDYKGLRCIIKNSTLKFSKPKDFNDPFEFHESLVDKRISLNHYIQIVQKREKFFSDGRLLKCIKEFNENYETAYALNNESFLRRKETTRVSCFSELNDDLLMWSHYADKHQGACIGFEFDMLFQKNIADYFSGFVKYEEDIHSFNLSEYKIKAIEHWILTKGKSWAYEKEFRIIIGSDPEEFIPFNEFSLKEIFFGCNLSEQRKKSIENLIFKKKKYSWIVTKEMKISKNKFALEISSRR